MSTWSEFWRLVCTQSPLLYVMLVFVTTLAILNAIAMALAEQSSGAFAVSLMVFAILGVTGGGIALLLWRCDRAHPDATPVYADED